VKDFEKKQNVKDVLQFIDGELAQNESWLWSASLPLFAK